MIDDFMDLDGMDLSEVKNPQGGSTAGYNDYQRKTYEQQNPQNQQNNRSYNNQGGGYNQNNNSGQYNSNNNNNNYRGNNNRGNYQKKEEVIEEPYVPISIFIDRDFPQEIKAKLISIAGRLINANYVVRYNADDMAVHEPISSLSTKKTEAFTPWKGFNNIESKHYYNTETAKHIASSNFPAWDKIPDAVKAMLARNVRMIFGDKNRSTTLCLITWSPDGASRAAEVNKDTGRSSFIIKLAATYGIPVVNIAKPNAEAALERAFNL